MNKIFVLLSIVTAVVSCLKLLNIKFSKDAQADVESVDLCLMDKKPSYKKYKWVSKKASRLNSPKRVSGDFFDYIFDDIDINDHHIENKLMDIYGEDTYE